MGPMGKDGARLAAQNRRLRQPGLPPHPLPGVGAQVRAAAVGSAPRRRAAGPRQGRAGFPAGGDPGAQGRGRAADAGDGEAGAASAEAAVVLCGDAHHGAAGAGACVSFVIPTLLM